MIDRYSGLPIAFVLAMAVAEPSSKHVLDAGTNELLQHGALKELLPQVRSEASGTEDKGAASDRVAQSCRNSVWRRC